MGQLHGITDVDWKVLGVSDKGELLIMSTSNVQEVTLGEKDNLDVSKSDYVVGVSKLNKLCLPYSKGINSTGARCITMQDINKITGYDMSTYNPNEISEFGNVVTYYFDGTEYPKFIGSNSVSGNLTGIHNTFTYYDKSNNSWHTKEISSTATKLSPEEIITLQNNFYTYDANYLNDTNFKEYSMLFKDAYGNKASYWIANSFINTTAQFVGFGYPKIVGDNINYSYLVYSHGYANEATAGLRVVVSIM